ncbi:MAG TPA: M15 family metallopeptidase [Acidimicrobiales bacterium]|nr:M15 family metallopeptidase [Acidimicrobiales bacterium]
MQPYPPRRSGPPPNYTLRRLVALTGVVVLAYVLWTLVGRVAGGDDSAAPITTTTRPTTTTMPLVAPPACAFPEQSEPTAYARPEDWFRTLVDPIHAVPEQYVPPDLVPASEAGYSADHRIRSVVVEDLNGLRNAILEAGVPEVAILAAYRSVADQQVLFDARVAELGFEGAAKGTARPGHSEHHLGTAIDVRPIGETDVDASFGETETGRWLAEHAWEHGFVVSYPAGAEDVTCYKYEPWHLRYLGPDLAGRVHASGLTLREYLWHWQTSGTEPGVAPASPPPPLPTVPASSEESAEDG